MNAVEFISAGAGSGKTYRLTQVLARALESGQARAAGIMATTFTVKAAAELRQRARKALLEAGRLDLATAIGQARIGTVNSVCGQLLQRFCFEIGLSPDQTVLSEAECVQLLKAAVDSVLDGEKREALLRYSARFCLDAGDWAKPVHSVVEAARSNGLSAQTLRPMGAQNARALLASWPESVEGIDFTGALVHELQALVQGLDAYVAEQEAAGNPVQKNTAGALEKAREIVRSFSDGSWTWNSWVAC